MQTEISRKIHSIMAREMGQLGKFIVKKQCQDIGCEPDEIEEKHLRELSHALGKVMVTFGGEAKAKIIEAEIKKLAHAAAEKKEGEKEEEHEDKPKEKTD